MNEDELGQAMAAAWEVLGTSIPDSFRQVGGAIWLRTGVEVAGLNGVWVTTGVEQAIDTDAIGWALDELAADGLPFCLMVRPGPDAGLRELAEGRGMQHRVQSLMGISDVAVHGRAAEGLLIRTVTERDGDLHARLVTAGFETAPGFLDAVSGPHLLAVPGVVAYVGEVDGEPVTTGMGVRTRGTVGIFNVATPPEHRRHGYGAALTARIVEDAFEDGATSAWLQPSAAGLAVYESLGFRTVDTYDVWTSA